MTKMKGYGKRSSKSSSNIYGSPISGGKLMSWGWKGGVVSQSTSYKDQMMQLSKDKTVFTPPKQY